MVRPDTEDCQIRLERPTIFPSGMDLISKMGRQFISIVMIGYCVLSYWFCWLALNTIQELERQSWLRNFILAAVGVVSLSLFFGIEATQSQTRES
jgi:uncharacterized membrane protein